MISKNSFKLMIITASVFILAYTIFSKTREKNDHVFGCNENDHVFGCNENDYSDMDNFYDMEDI